MNIKYKVSEEGLKKLADVISGILGWGAKYINGDSVMYEIGNYTLTRDGVLKCPVMVTGRLLNTLVENIAKHGFEPHEIEKDSFTVCMEKSYMDEQSLRNLMQIVENKAELFKKVFETDKITVEVDENNISFPWFTLHNYDNEALVYSRFIIALCDMAKKQKKVIPKKLITNGDEKYHMRMFLIRLGLKGDDNKNIRKILLKNLSGDSCHKNTDLK